MTEHAFLLPTNALYSCADLQEYDKAKDQYIQQTLGYRSGMSNEDKWRALIDKFLTVVPSSVHSHFNLFRDDRLNVAQGNRYVLQLDKALDYFENFYFLYSNNDPQYQLSTEPKKTLLTDILAGMAPNVCEPGKTTQFDSGLQKARKDSNWVMSELDKHRANIIQAIADEYNHQYAVSSAYSIHTVMQMFKLAKQYGFGVKPLQQVDDPYLALMNKEDMNAYFKQVSRVKFSQYERDAVVNLTQHVMIEMTQWLQTNGVNLANWDTQSLVLTSDQLDKFSRFFPSLFANESYYIFGQYVDEDNDDTDAPLTFELFNKHNFEREIQQCVLKKLTDDGTFLSLSLKDPQWEKSPGLKDVRWAPGVRFEDFKEFINTLQATGTNAGQLRALFQRNQHINIITAYPSLILEYLIQHSALWRNLPKTVKHNINLIDAFVEDLSHRLLVAKPEEEAALIDLILKVTQVNPEFFEQLPSQLLNRKSVAISFVRQNGLLLKWMSTESRSDRDVIDAAVLQNSQARIYAYDQQTLVNTNYQLIHNRVNHLAPPDALLSLCRGDDVYARLERNQNAEILLTQRVVSTGKLVRLAQVLTPKELKKINQSRIRRQLPSLPYCQGNGLQLFMAEVNNDLWFSSGYLAVKREVSSATNVAKFGHYLSADYRHNLANQSIAESNQWVLAMITYQKQLCMYHVAFKTLGDVMTQLNVSVRASWGLFVSCMDWLKMLGVSLLVTGLMIGSYCLYQVIHQWLVDVIMGFLVANFSSVLFLVPFIVAAVFLSALSFFVNDRKAFFTVAVISVVLATVLAFFGEMVVALIVSYLLDVALAAVVSLAFALLLKAWGIMTNDPMTWSEIKMQAWTAFIYTMNSERLIGQQIESDIKALGTPLLFTFPQLIFAATAPWFTRTWATIVAPQMKLTPEEAITFEVEESIFRLLDSDEPSAVRKGEGLQELWEQVQADVKAGGTTLSQGLDKQYPVRVFGEEQHLSFAEVAATPRVDVAEFSPKAPDERFSFFGLRGQTTTYNRLQKYLGSDNDQPILVTV